MSAITTGDPSTVAAYLSRTVVDATNATPIVIETSVSHQFATGDTVVVSGVLGNTAANGTWTIVKTSSSKFQLVGSTGNGAYTSGGTAVDYSLTPQFTIPSDGDGPPKASDINVALEADADRAQYLGLSVSALPTLASLKAINTTSLAHNVVRHVRGHGLFVFDSTLAVAEALPFILTPTTGPGRWVASGGAVQTSVTRLISPGECSLYTQAIGATSPDIASGWAYANATSSALTIGTPETLECVTFVDVATGSAIARGLRAQISAFCIDGATLSQVRVRLRSGGTHGALPLLMPKFGITRASRLGAPEALLSTGSGLVTDSSASAAAYNADHDITFTPDQNNVIDRAAYYYQAFLFNEGHTNALAGLSVLSFELTFSNIQDGRRS